jgi:hypothetical protein
VHLPEGKLASGLTGPSTGEHWSRSRVQARGETVTAPSERLIRRIRRDFGRGTDDEVIRRLTALSPDDSSERIQAALVLGAAGKWNRFEQQLRRLELDWRDVLVVGGLADDDWPARLVAELPAASDGHRRDADRLDPRTPAQARAPRRDWRSPRRSRARGRHRR